MPIKTRIDLAWKNIWIFDFHCHI